MILLLQSVKKNLDFSTILIQKKNRFVNFEYSAMPEYVDLVFAFVTLEVKFLKNNIT